MSRGRHSLVISACANIINNIFVSECRVSALKEQGEARMPGRHRVMTEPVLIVRIVCNLILATNT